MVWAFCWTAGKVYGCIRLNNYSFRRYEALDLVTAKMGALCDEFGGKAAAFVWARSANEDIYMLQKMARTAFKTNNIDN